jgi:hypothetical protein
MKSLPLPFIFQNSIGPIISFPCFQSMRIQSRRIQRLGGTEASAVPPAKKGKPGHINLPA